VTLTQPASVITVVIEAIFTPGHTNESICLKYGNLPLSGDTFFNRFLGRTGLPTGSLEDLEQSIRTKFYTGHGDPTIIAEVARKSGVKHFVYSSVGSAHRKTGIPHFDNKWRIKETVRKLGFPSHTVIRAAFFMENFASPWFKPGIDIAGDALTMPAAAKVIGTAAGITVEFVRSPIEEVRKLSADIEGNAKESGIKPTKFFE
jgi:hypothetical protein